MRTARSILVAAMLATVGVLAGPLGAGAGLAVTDDFDRADGPLGPDWTVQAGTFNVSSNAAVGSSLALATYDGAASDSATIDVAFDGTGTEYLGVVLDYLDVSSNIFVKIQNQDGAAGLDRIFCYEGNNGSSWTSPSFFDTANVITTARMTVTIEPDRNVAIELSQINGGTGTESFDCPNAPDTGGTGVGIVQFAGLGSIDNFTTAGVQDTTAPEVTCEEPPTFTVGESGEVSATVTDDGSGPAEETVSAPADTATAGDKVVELTGADVAGNETTVECAYTVEAEATTSTSSSSTTTSTTTTTPPGDVDAVADATAAQPTTASPTFTG